MAEELTAILRQPGSDLETCELVYLRREEIDHALLRRQHRAYRDNLLAAGLAIHELPSLPEHPDSVFVEDCALVLDEVAVMTRPGAPSRRGEVEKLAPKLAEYREILHIEDPGTMDGGDLLALDKTILFGLSKRSNPAGLEQLQRLLSPYGYRVQGMPVSNCLHLKSAISRLDANRVLVNPNWIQTESLSETEVLLVPAEEPYGANVLALPDRLICSKSYPQTNQMLRSEGFTVTEMDFSELHKMEAAMTCPSLIFRSRSGPQ